MKKNIGQEFSISNYKKLIDYIKEAKLNFKNFKDKFENLGLVVKVLTGSTKSSDRKILLNDLKNGSINLLIGTHAIFEQNVIFNNLGYAVIDEQHRFGVKQRSKIWEKNNPPPHGFNNDRYTNSSNPYNEFVWRFRFINY